MVKTILGNKNCRLPMGLNLTVSKNQFQAHNSSSLAFLLQALSRASSTSACHQHLLPGSS